MIVVIASYRSEVKNPAGITRQVIFNKCSIVKDWDDEKILRANLKGEAFSVSSYLVNSIEMELN